MSAIRSAKRKFFSNLSSLVKTPKEFWSAYHSLLPNWQRIPVMLSNGSITASLPPQNVNFWIAILPKFSLTQIQTHPLIPLYPTPHLLSFLTSPVLGMKFFICCLPFPGKHHLALVVFLVPCFGIQPLPLPPPSPSCLIYLCHLDRFLQTGNF